MNILFRADSSSTIGTGHIMRDLVLAKQYPNSNIFFATQNLEGNLNHKIIESGYEVIDLQSSNIDELDSVIKNLSIDLIIIDHYDIGYKEEKQLKNQNPTLKILSFDDTYEQHYCDVLLNHNISADEHRYKDLAPKGCELRCGGKYTLIREEFHQAKKLLKVKNEKFTLFVAMGGADTLNITQKVLKVLEEFEVAVNVLTTSANQNLKYLKSYCQDKNWVKLHIDSNRVAIVMRESDFAIVTPSVVLHEVMFMDLPFVAIKTADNQDDMFNYLKKEKFLTLESIELNSLKDILKGIV